jgi:hypothetical protein
LVVGLAATALTAGTGKFAFAQQPTGDVIGELVNNEGIFVDGKTFKIARGKAKGDPAAQIAPRRSGQARSYSATTTSSTL